MSIEDIQALIDRENWDSLAEMVQDWSRQWTGGLNQDAEIIEKEEALQELFSIIYRAPKTFWKTANSKCVTIKAFKNYLRKSYQNEFTRLLSVDDNWVEWLKNRIWKIFSTAKCNIICGEKHKRRWFYGLIKWGRSLSEIGMFNGIWGDIEAIREKYPALTAKKTSERKARYSDEEIITGCSRLLDEIKKYCQGADLAKGMIYCRWVDLNQIYLSFDDQNSTTDYELSRDPECSYRRDLASEVMAKINFKNNIKKVISQLNLRQRVIFVNFSLPRILTPKEDRKKEYPFQAMGEKLQLSHQTIRDEHRIIKDELKNVLKEMDNKEWIGFFNILKNKFEKNEFGNLLIGETTN